MDEKYTPNNCVILTNIEDYEALYEAIYEFTLSWFDGYGDHRIIEAGDTVFVVPEGEAGTGLRLFHLSRADHRSAADGLAERGGD